MKKDLMRIMPILFFSPLIITSCTNDPQVDVVKETSTLNLDNNIEHGIIKFQDYDDGDKVQIGTLVKIKAIADKDYKLDKAYVNGVDVTSPMQFKVEEANINYVLTATFIKDEHGAKISFDASCMGLISLKNALNPDQLIEIGTKLIFEFDNNSGYELINLYVDGIDITSTKTYEVTEEKTLIITANLKKVVNTATFKLGTISHGEVYLVSHNWGEKISVGTVVSFNPIADNGYELASLTVNNIDISNDYTFTIPDVADVEYVVNATFIRIPEEIQYSTIKLNNTYNGSISFKNYNDGDRVPVGKTVELVAHPAPGYELFGVYVNDQIDITNTLRFTIPEGNKQYLFSAEFNKSDVSEQATISIPTNIPHGKAYVSMQGPIGKVNANQSVNFVIDPEEGYELESFKVGAEDITKTLNFTPKENKTYTCTVTFRPRVIKSSGSETIDGQTYTFTNELEKELIYDEKYIGIPTNYDGVDSNSFYDSNYKSAKTYEEAKARTKANLLSGDYIIPAYNANYNNVKNPTNNTGTKFFNAKQRYIVDGQSNVIGYIINDLDNDPNNDLIIFKGAAYVSMDEVSAYFFAFNEIPANWNPDKKDKGKADVIKNWGQYGRVNDGNFGSKPSTYPYQPILEGQGTVFNYRESDFGTDGDFYFYNQNGTPNIKQTPYNNGHSIARGTCRILYTHDRGKNQILPGEERHVYYTWTHYNTFEEYLNYRGGYNYMCGSLCTGNKYNGKKGELKYDVIQPLPYNLAIW